MTCIRSLAATLIGSAQFAFAAVAAAQSLTLDEALRAADAQSPRLTAQRALATAGLAVVDVELIGTHGGSLRIFAKHEEHAGAPSPSVKEVLALESELHTVEGHMGFADAVFGIKRDLVQFLLAAKGEGKRVVGYGAPGKGNTLLNYCGIGTDFLDFTVDRNPYKHGRFSPGMHIPIKPVEVIDAAKPDYVLLLHRNLRDEIVRQMRHIGDWGGKFIIPIPDVHVIEPSRSVS